jgi:hypothetical protein
MNTQAKNQHLHLTRIENIWTPIQPIFKEIQIDANSSHLITHIQFHVVFAIAHTIHKSQGLALHYVAFDLIGATHHDLTYTSLSQISSKKSLYLSTPLENNNFQVDVCVMEEMHRLCTKNVWKSTITRYSSLLCKTYRNPIIKH